MKTEEEIDRLIKQSLNKENAAFYDSLDEEGFFSKVKSLYTGKFGWMAILMAFVHTGVVVVSIYCAYHLFNTTDAALMIQYGTALFLAWSFGAMIKLWHWMQMDKNTILREMKRLEFQIAVLMEKDRNN